MMRATRTDTAARAIVGVVSAGLLIMAARVGQLQLSPSPRLVQHIQPRTSAVSLPPDRGPILDRRGRELATSRFGWQVFIDPTELPRDKRTGQLRDLDAHIGSLAEAMGVPADEFGEKLLLVIAENERRAANAPVMPEDGPPSVRQFVGGLLGFKREPETSTVLVSMDDEDEAAEQGGPVVEPYKNPIRYVRVSGVLEKEKVDKVRALNISGVHLEQRLVREYPGGAPVAAIIGRLGGQLDPQSGAERSHNELLTGERGRVSFVRDSTGRPIWMNPDSYEPATPGKSLRLSIDLELQRLATEELVRGVYENNAAGGRLVLMDSMTGEIVAMADVVRHVPEAVPFPWANADGSLDVPVSHGDRYITIFEDTMRAIDPALGRNRCVQDVYEPGSTFKPFVWAVVTQLGVIGLEEHLPTGNGQWRTPYGRTINDVKKFPSLAWQDVLLHSSNIGMTQGAMRISRDQLRNAVLSFGFGSKTDIGLPAETPGIVTSRKDWTQWTQTSVSFGQEIAVTPVQMARAFCIFARTGPLAGTLPTARLIAPEYPDRPELFRRVVDPRAAEEVRRILSAVAAHMEARMAEKDKSESHWKYAIFGKSGTAQIPLGKAPKGKRRPPGNKGYFEKQFNSSFIAAGPTENPRLVCLVVIDDPGPELRPRLRHFGSHTAGPVVRRVLERSLTYLGVPPSPESSRVKAPEGPVAE